MVAISSYDRRLESEESQPRSRIIPTLAFFFLRTVYETISCQPEIVKDVGQAESEFDLAEQWGQLLFRCKGFGAHSR